MMQQGLASLAPAQQGMAPGQAAPQPVLPQQQSATPQAVTGTLERLPPQQLLSMYNNPQDMTPKWAVATAYAKAIEQARLMQMAQGQSAMAQSAAQAQQPPVVQQIMSQPMPAAQGGIMQGYAGGGAVAFERGGRVQHFANGSDPFGLMSDPAAYLAADTLRVETAQRNEQIRALQEQLAFLEQAGAPQAAAVRAQLERLQGKMPQAVATEAASETQRLKARPTGIMGQIAPAVPRPGAGRPTAAPAAAPAAQSGVAGLMGPEIDPGLLGMRNAVAERQEAIRNAAKTPEAVLQARAGIDTLLKDIVESRRAEEQRMQTRAEKTLEEARARAKASPLDDPVFLGQIIGGMRGAKRFGEAVSGAAVGAGQAQEARNKALQAAEERYELSRKDVFNLANLRQQVQLDQAKLVEARASGDAEKAVKAALDLAQSKEALAKFTFETQEKLAERGFKERELAQRGDIAREQMANALKVAGMQADRTPAEVRLMEWLRDPKNKALYEEVQSSKRAEDRLLKLYEIYTKNKLTLGNMSFEEFAAGLQGAGAGNAGVPPPGAVRLKGQ